MTELLYRPSCPLCAHTIDLLGTSLSKIIQARRLSQTGEPFLVFVCQGCMAAFQYDYPNRVAEGVIDEGLKTKEYRSQQCFSVVAPCDRHMVDECDESLIELLAIRPADTNKNELIQREMPRWNLSGTHCKNGHRILLPDPTEVYERLDTA